ncbi:hypothetical protein AA464_11775 [Salmonella enterica subsp. enterica serovar Newport]|nr:hypothetical protein [Salmonella enterica subsp. enterica serovar Newport]
MEIERKNCLICGSPDVPVLLLDHDNIYKYRCPSCKDYCVYRTVVSKTNGLNVSEYLSLMSANPPDNKIMYIQYAGNSAINVFYADE